MKNVISILPPRLGGLDMLLPIFLEMKRHPDGIAQLEFGQKRTSNIVDLDMELEDIEQKENIQSNLIENVKHKECVVNLFNKVGLPLS
tara:strand:+ start:5185 stop:5448 length:264 start_codon:yes stop_codon:yes gene_type:complete